MPASKSIRPGQRLTCSFTNVGSTASYHFSGINPAVIRTNHLIDQSALRMGAIFLTYKILESKHTYLARHLGGKQAVFLAQIFKDMKGAVNLLIGMRFIQNETETHF
jgi:hypothetical protein